MYCFVVCWLLCSCVMLTFHFLLHPNVKLNSSEERNIFQTVANSSTPKKYYVWVSETPSNSLITLRHKPVIKSGSLIPKPGTRKLMAKSPVAFSKQVVGT